MESGLQVLIPTEAPKPKNPWGAPKVSTPCSLTSVMDEELARRFAQEERDRAVPPRYAQEERDRAVPPRYAQEERDRAVPPRYARNLILIAQAYTC